MSANPQGIIAVTGRAHCQRQVAFLKYINHILIPTCGGRSEQKDGAVLAPLLLRVC